MITTTLTVASKHDALELEVLILEPEGKIQGIFQIAHGMSENKERYLPIMEFMAEAGYACIIHDHRGHGNSVKNKEDWGYLYEGGAHALVEDLHQITLFAKKRWEGVPLILLGHSMGALIACTYLQKYDAELETLIVCGAPSKNPAVSIGMLIAKLESLFWGGHHKSKVLEAMSFGPYKAKFPKEQSKFCWTCSVPEEVQKYEESPACGFTFTADGYQGLFTLMKETYQDKNWQCKYPELPILFIGGEDDPCIGSGEKFVQMMKHLKQMGYHKVTGKRYPGLRHEILNEIGKEKIYQNILDYIKKQKQRTAYGRIDSISEKL